MPKLHVDGAALSALWLERAELLERLARLDQDIAAHLGNEGAAWHGGSPLLDARAAAAALGVSVDSFDRYVAREVPRVMIGRLVRYDPRDLAAFVAARKIGGAPEQRREAEPPRRGLSPKAKQIHERIIAGLARRASRAR